MSDLLNASPSCSWRVRIPHKVREDFGEMLDTSPRARATYYALLRGLSPEQRAAKVASLSRMVRGLAVEGIRRGAPGASDEELRARLAARLYGRDVARRLYGSIPDDAR